MPARAPPFQTTVRKLPDPREDGRGEALKAVVRKRLKAIYAVMRDKAPYTAWPRENGRGLPRRWAGASMERI